MLRNAAIAAVAAAVVVGIASAALFVTTAPAVVSLLVEPLSLLLLPGLAAAIVFSGSRDFSAEVAVGVTFGVYFVLFFAGLWWRSKRSLLAGRGAR